MGQIEQINIDPAPRPAEFDFPDVCRMVAVAKFVNSAAIAAVYGDMAAERIRVSLERRLLVLLKDEGLVGFARWTADDELELRMSCPAIFAERAGLEVQAGGQSYSELAVAHIVQVLLSSYPIDISGHGVLPCLAVAAAAVDQHAAPEAAVTAAGELARQRAFACQPILPDIGYDANSRARYRADMAMAVTVTGIVQSGGLMLAWQPVVSIDESGAEDVLYYEGLARVIDSMGAGCAPGSFIPALERLGAIRLLDAFALRLTLDRLERDPSLVLGCNISAQSAVLDGWWNDELQRLEADPAMARRLVLEITESSAFPDISAVIEFAGRLQRVGVSIAIDDFGVGHAAFRNIVALRPDLVKIDAFFLHQALLRGSPADHAAFNHLVSLAGSYAATVIIEGVENEAAATIARAAGARWAQGFYFGSPAFSRGIRRSSHAPDERQQLVPPRVAAEGVRGPGQNASAAHLADAPLCRGTHAGGAAPGISATGILNRANVPGTNKGGRVAACSYQTSERAVRRRHCG